MASVALTGKDIVKIGSRVLFDFADGDVATLTFPNTLVEVKTGKGGNSIYALNETGRTAELSLRLIRGSSDDIYLNSLLSAQMLDFPSAILVSGQVIKRLGDGNSVVHNDTYIVEGGVFDKNVDVNYSTDGATDQAVSVWHIKFTNSKRAIF